MNSGTTKMPQPALATASSTSPSSDLKMGVITGTNLPLLLRNPHSSSKLASA